MTGLLVSVRSASEAESALAGGAAVIDVKEPDRGALGAADPATWRAVLVSVAGRAPVSAALGELFSPSGNNNVLFLAPQTAGLAFAKIGLAGAVRHGDWQRRWSEVLAILARQVAPVAVAYADWKTAEAPCPETVIDAGADLGCKMLLLDTFDKARGHLLNHFDVNALDDLCRRTSQRGMQVVLAGSLSESLLNAVLPLAPALIAVRGAVCQPNRRGAVAANLVKKLARAIRTHGLERAAPLSEPWGA